MNITFIGHHDLIIDDALQKRIKTEIKNVLSSNNSATFFCGGYGSFDIACAKICNELKASYPEIKIAFVTPYIHEGYQQKLQDIQSSNLYDEIVYPELESVPLKYAISKRNEWMIDSSDLVIAYVSNSFGGSYKSLQYAKRKGKTVLNLTD